MSAFNDKVIVEFRANDGRVDSAGFGTSLLLLHTTGARTGTLRVNPAMSLRDGDGWLIVASAKGAATDPAWAHNLRASVPRRSRPTSAGPPRPGDCPPSGSPHEPTWTRSAPTTPHAASPSRGPRPTNRCRTTAQ